MALARALPDPAVLPDMDLSAAGGGGAPGASGNLPDPASLPDVDAPPAPAAVATPAVPALAPGGFPDPASLPDVVTGAWARSELKRLLKARDAVNTPSVLNIFRGSKVQAARQAADDAISQHLQSFGDQLGYHLPPGSPSARNLPPDDGADQIEWMKQPWGSPDSVAEGLRKDMAMVVSGTAAGESSLLHPAAWAFDKVAQEAGLLPKDRASAFGRYVQGLAETAQAYRDAAQLQGTGQQIAGAVVSGIGGLVTGLPAAVGAIKAAGPAGLAALGAYQALPSEDYHDVARGAVEGLALQGILGSTSPLPAALRVPAQAAAFAGLTAAGGGDLQDTIASGLLGGALASPGPEIEAGVRAAAKTIADSNWYRMMTIRERGLVVQDVQQRIDGMKAQGMSEGQILRALNRTYGGASPEFVDAIRARAQGEHPVSPAEADAAASSAQTVPTDLGMDNPAAATAGEQGAKPPLPPGYKWARTSGGWVPMPTGETGASGAARGMNC